MFLYKVYSLSFVLPCTWCPCMSVYISFPFSPCFFPLLVLPLCPSPYLALYLPNPPPPYCLPLTPSLPICLPFYLFAFLLPPYVHSAHHPIYSSLSAPCNPFAFLCFPSIMQEASPSTPLYHPSSLSLHLYFHATLVN